MIYSVNESYLFSSFRSFRIMDDDRSRTLDFSEFRKGLRDYGLIDISNADAKKVFDTFDRSGDGKVDFDEFLLALRVNGSERGTGRPRAICGQRYPLPCFA